MDARYPDVVVQLSGEDGNAFSIISRVQRALRSAGVSTEERDSFRTEATSGSYDDLLATVQQWVEVE